MRAARDVPVWLLPTVDILVEFPGFRRRFVSFPRGCWEALPPDDRTLWIEDCLRSYAVEPEKPFSVHVREHALFGLWVAATRGVNGGEGGGAAAPPHL